MTTSSTPSRVALLTLALCSASLHGQSVTPPATTAPTPAAKPKPHVAKPAAEPKVISIDPNLIVLDPAHGGNDPGGKLSGNLLEKDVNLQLAQRLRSLLQARGFTVVLTREADPVAPPPQPAPADGEPAPPPSLPPPQVTSESRAETANRAHPVACLILHTTAAGHGVHLYTSALTPPSAMDTPRDIQLWDNAQAPIIPQSLRLVNDLTQAISGLRLPLVTGRASIGPIDSMTCPAVILELAPNAPNGDQNTPASDEAYQARVAESIAQALVFWRGHAEIARPASPAVTPTPAAPAEVKPAPKPKPKPRPPVDPDNPDATPAPKPVPIVRRPPPSDTPATPPPGARP